MINLQRNISQWMLIALVVYGIIAVATSGWWGVIETSEARYAEIAREMYRSGDYVNPSLLSIHHYHKPPLTYWITDIGYALFGMNEFGARFFLQVCFVVQLFVVFRLGSVLFDERTGFLATIIYASFPMVMISIRGLTTDAYLNTFILAAVYTWCKWKATSRPLWLYASMFSLGLAFFTKGPVALIVPVLMMIGMTGLFPNHITNRIHYLFAIVLCLITAFSWFAYLMHSNKEYIDYFFVRHTVERFAQADVFTRKQPWWYFIAFAPLLALPWGTVFFLRRVNVQTTTSIRARRMMIYWIIVPLIFFSLSSSKLVLYVLPLYPGVGIICAWYFVNKISNQKQFEKILYWLVMSIAMIMAVSFIVISSIRDITVSIICVAFVLIMVTIRRTNSDDTYSVVSIWSFAWTFLLLIVSAVFFSNHELMSNSTRPIAEWIKDHHMKERNIIAYNVLLPSLAFDLDKEIISLDDGNRYLAREVQFEKDEHWKNSLYNIREDVERERLSNKLSQPTVIVAKGEIAAASGWLTQNFPHRVVIGKWVLFYN
jgi:4-amino-4-deoxy-L-arabinose transferase-like glycosyltransferase